MNPYEYALFTVALVSTFIAMILYIVFGQTTVRKLRKNEEAKDVLGLQFASGWDIVNVAQALAIPRILMQKLKKSRLAALYADVDVLHKHTNKFDRILGGLFYWLLMFSGLSFASLVIIDALGFFD